MSNWIASAVGSMHINRISNIDIANHIGVTPEYISMVLNEKKNMPNAEQRIMTAINELIAEKN